MSIKDIWSKYNQRRVELDVAIAEAAAVVAKLQGEREDVEALLTDAAQLIEARGGALPASSPAPTRAPAPARRAVAPAAKPAPRTPAPPTPRTAPKPAFVAPKVAPAASKPAAAASTSKGAFDVNDLGIVEAAVYIAQQKNIRSANAGDVLDWFNEYGYTSRSGLPSRNSVYVSLNREAKKKTSKVERFDRGQFNFLFES